jgi:hypothetical protein
MSVEHGGQQNRTACEEDRGIRIAGRDSKNRIKVELTSGYIGRIRRAVQNDFCQYGSWMFEIMTPLLLEA